MGNSEPHVSVSGLMPCGQSGVPVSQMPEKSGLPSGARGAGAAKLGAPVAVFGTPAVGYFSHCAAAGDDRVNAAAATTTNEIDHTRRPCTVYPPGIIMSYHFDHHDACHHSRDRRAGSAGARGAACF